MADEQVASTEAEEEKDESLKPSEADTETSEGEESEDGKPSKAAKRIQQLIEQRDKALGVAGWYREHVGDPNDVVAFREWKASQVKTAEKAEDEGEISPAKLAEIKKLMRRADPEYAAFLERSKEEQQAKADAQWDAAEDEVRELAAKELGLSGKASESDIAWVAQQTMLAIQNDPKLMRLWQTGNLTCIKKGFKIVQERHDNLGKSISRMKLQATEKRKIAKLPTLPSAQGSLTGKEKTGEKEKGITKSTHEDAWAVLQQGMQE